MSTDLVLVEREVVEGFRTELTKHLRKKDGLSFQLVDSKGRARVHGLVSDAKAKGSQIESTADSKQQTGPQLIPMTILGSVDESMEFFRTEAFGPCLGIVAVSDGNEAVKIVNDGDYGLSAAIWTQNHYRALELARRLQVASVHINSSTVHDEATLPHGGTKLSGFGRFGAEWGLKEFVETQTVIIHP